jgi:hypothetical protein
MIRSLSLVCIVLFFMSCGSKTALQFESPDKTRKIELSGSKASALDSWILTLTATSNTHSKSWPIEIYQGDLNNNNVQSEWTSDVCILTIKSQDDHVHHFKIQFDASDISLSEY